MISKVYFESKDYLVVYKPSGVATVPLKKKLGGTFLDDVGTCYPEVLSVSGENAWEGGVLHRLDTPTAGLVLLARNQDSYDWAIAEQDKDRIIKKYRAFYSSARAFDDGFEPFPYGNIVLNGGVITSRFRAYGVGAKSVRPVVLNPRFKEGKVYSTEVSYDTDSSVICTLTRGFRHQIRAHLAWSGHPLIGDELYGGEKSSSFGLEAICIEFKTRNGEVIKVSTSQH